MFDDIWSHLYTYNIIVKGTKQKTSGYWKPALSPSPPPCRKSSKPSVCNWHQCIGEGQIFCHPAFLATGSVLRFQATSLALNAMMKCFLKCGLVCHILSLPVCISVDQKEERLIESRFSGFQTNVRTLYKARERSFLTVMVKIPTSKYEYLKKQMKASATWIISVPRKAEMAIENWLFQFGWGWVTIWHFKLFFRKVVVIWLPSNLVF